MFVAQEPSRATTIRVTTTACVTTTGESRNFSYEAIVNNRKRDSNGNVSGIKYGWRGGWFGKWRRWRLRETEHLLCLMMGDAALALSVLAAVRLMNQRSGRPVCRGGPGASPVTVVWVDCGRRADFEVGRS